MFQWIAYKIEGSFYNDHQIKTVPYLTFMYNTNDMNISKVGTGIITSKFYTEVWKEVEWLTARANIVISGRAEMLSRCVAANLKGIIFNLFPTVLLM